MSLEWITKKVKVSDLKFYEGNPRKMSKEQAEQLLNSLKKFNLAEIPAINTDNTVIAGNMRVRALIELGRQGESIEVRCPNRKLTDEEAREYLLRSNKNTGEWDFDLLANFDESLLKDIGFDSQELDAIFQTDPKPQDDDVPDERKTSIKRGDIFQLGAHRLGCLDATSKDDVAKLMDGKKAVLMNTDPPYGIDFVKLGKSKNQSKKYNSIENDDLTDGKELQVFLEKAIKTAVPYLIDKCPFYLWHPMLTQGTFFAAAAAADILINRQIIWVKPSIVFGRGDYHWKHELCFYGWRRGHKPVFYGKRNQSTVWEIGRENDKIHPTQKPVALFEIPILNHTKRGEICYEPFAGSGSQLIACEKTSRICFGLEIEPIYMQVCLDRWEKFTGKKAMKINL